MDTLRGQFDPADFSDDLSEFELADDYGSPEPPPSPIGQDERRMQVRAYNHWAGLLGNKNFPSIEDLEPESLTDFGPFSVLLEFTDGIEDPAIRFVGKELADECGTANGIERLSDVPARSLLSRITDHYLQILANQAPIGFEAEFVNQREATILYRGILLPYSSNDETIDFIYGVINWKEMADQQTTDELILEVDQTLEELTLEEVVEDTEEDNILDLGDFSAAEVAEEAPVEPVETKDAMPRPSFGSLLTPEGFDDDDEDDEDSYLPAGWSLSDPNNIDDDAEYADDSADVYDDDYDPDSEDDETELGLTRLVEEEFERSGRQPIDIDELGIEGDAIDPEAGSANAHDIAHEEFASEYAPIDDAEELEPAAEEDSFDLTEDFAETDQDSLEGRVGEDTIDGEILSEDSFVEESREEESLAVEEPTEEAHMSVDDFFVEHSVESESTEADAEQDSIEPEPIEAEVEAEEAGFETDEAAAPEEPLELAEIAEVAPPALADEPEIALEPAADAGDGLYDCLADARELAQTASNAEDRSRVALYAAVGRAYDVSLAAIDAPEDYDELLEENGLTVQDRAPMTPVVKLVFGADYDKTRITEYASALTHAHRMGISRGKLGTYLSEYDGGLKGVVNAERRLRREESGKPVAEKDEVRASLARKLRAIEGTDLADIPVEGSEFALVMIRRTEDGDIVVLGEIDDDIAFIERAGRKIIG